MPPSIHPASASALDPPPSAARLLNHVDDNVLTGRPIRATCDYCLSVARAHSELNLELNDHASRRAEGSDAATGESAGGIDARNASPIKDACSGDCLNACLLLPIQDHLSGAD